MNKAMDKLLDNIKFDKKYVLFSLLIVIFGIISGSFFIIILNSTDKNLVIEYIKSFISNINTINSLDIFSNTCISNYIYILLFMIFGYSFILFIFNILLLFYKSFIIGFSISSFILTYKVKGIILSIIYVFPHLIINILIFALIVAYTTKLALTMIKYIKNKNNVNMRSYFNKLLYVILFASIIILISSLYEGFILPKILKYIIKIFKFN